MSQISSLVSQHPAIVALACYWLFSAAVSAMPTPTDQNGAGYRWAFTFLHLVLGNLDKLVAAKGGTVAQNTVDAKKSTQA